MEFIRFVVTDDEGTVLDSVDVELPLDEAQIYAMQDLGLYVSKVMK